MVATKVDPPSGKPRGSRWAALAAELRAHPNEWRTPDFQDELSNLSTDRDRINKGRYREFRPIGHWKAAVEDGQLKVCYTPPPDQGDQP